MPIPGPSPAAEPIDPALRGLFAAAGADWTAVRQDKPPRPGLCPRADRWLDLRFFRSVETLGHAIGAGQPAMAALRDVVEAGRFQPVTAVPRITVLTRTGAAARATPMERTQACQILTAWLAPLLDAPAYDAWLEELAGAQWFWRGGDPASPAVPMPVRRREAARDQELLDRWIQAPPRPQPAAGASPAARARAERRYQAAMAAYQRERERAAAFLRSEPTRPGLTVPPGASVQERRLLERNRRAAATPGFPLLVLDGRPVPANLFVAEVATPVADYLAMVAAVLRPATEGTGLFMPLMGVAYGMLALALVPINCLYDNVHGTCTVETLLPRLAASAATLRAFRGQRLRAALLGGPERRRIPAEVLDDPAVDRVLGAFGAWSTALADGLRQQHLLLLQTAAAQSGGRVRTPAPGQLAPGGEWVFTIAEPQDDGSTVEVDRVAEEIIAYEQEAGVSKREAPAHAEIFWLLRAAWDRVGTAVAMVNQAGMRFWFNAANNRWGGHHPPHRSHRQGCSVDFDVGFGWRPGHKVPNVKKRDHLGRALPDEAAPGNRGNVACLHGMNRLAGWVGTQAFLLVGVDQYLYGDAQLVEEAQRHLLARLTEAGRAVVRPARMDGVVDAAGHNDHWHFEVLPGQAPGPVGQYAFQVADPDLLDRLRAWAVARDRDPSFWLKIAGLRTVPAALADFDGLPDATDWKHWWGRGHAEPDEETYPPSDAGISLLPVWAPAEARDTFDADACWDPERDEPAIFAPGQAGA
jgi:hypothetical protein